jgi:hypothetical protein
MLPLISCACRLFLEHRPTALVLYEQEHLRRRKALAASPVAGLTAFFYSPPSFAIASFDLKLGESVNYISSMAVELAHFLASSKVRDAWQPTLAGSA